LPTSLLSIDERKLSEVPFERQEEWERRVRFTGYFVRVVRGVRDRNVHEVRDWNVPEGRRGIGISGGSEVPEQQDRCECQEPDVQRDIEDQVGAVSKTAADRARTHDPRLSVEEGYGTLEGYVCTVQRAAARAVKERFLLQEDADRLIREAKASAVLSNNGESPLQNREIADRICRSPSP
jgi:hypothetical protein